MYSNLLACLDNSVHSNAAASLSIAIASMGGARLTGCHAYAARLHNSRFLEMEEGLAPEYRKEDALRETREVHDTLITKGLRIISDSYTAVFQAQASASGVPAIGLSREGKNFEELLKEAEDGGYDLVLLGRLGLGIVPTSRIGSVAERVARRIRKDVIVAGPKDHGGPILAAIDGSPASFGALKAALELSVVFGRPVEAIAAFDPVFHLSAFRSIAGVLTEEAGRVFRFNEQEKLHEEIIDKGLARIYSGHLKTAERVAASLGFPIKTALLSGKAPDEIIKHAARTDAFMAAFGRTGAHAVEGLDIGSTAENCLRELPCHVLLSSGEIAAEAERTNPNIVWTEEAEEILGRIPAFASGVVRNMVEDEAAKAGVKTITASLMREVRKRMDGK